MNKVILINHYLSKKEFKKYLEIGVHKGYSYSGVDAIIKDSVDPDENSPAIYHLTSDDFFETLCDAIQKENNTKHVFVAGEIVHLQKKTGQTKVHTAHFAGFKITKKNWNTVLETHNWNFLLNDGNWTAHKDVIECFNDKANEEQIRATDSLLLAKQMVEGGYTYYVVPGLKYIHTVHDDSEWLKTEAISLRLLRTTNWKIEN